MFLKIVQVKQFTCHALYPSLCFSSTAFVSTFSPVDKPVDDTDISVASSHTLLRKNPL